jgi:hypothetical protein
MNLLTMFARRKSRKTQPNTQVLEGPYESEEIVLSTPVSTPPINHNEFFVQHVVNAAKITGLYHPSDTIETMFYEYNGGITTNAIRGINPLKNTFNNTSIPSVSTSDAEKRMLSEEYAKTVINLASRSYDEEYFKRASEITLTPEESEKIKDALNKGFEEFYARKMKQFSREIANAKREYDMHRTDYDITRILNHARNEAERGNVEDVIKEMSTLERRVIGNWDKEIFEVYRAAYEAQFEDSIKKANKALALSKIESALRYFQKAEQSSNEIGLGFEASNDNSVKKYVDKKNTDIYNAYCKEKRELQQTRMQIIDILQQRLN